MRVSPATTLKAFLNNNIFLHLVQTIDINGIAIDASDYMEPPIWWNTRTMGILGHRITTQTWTNIRDCLFRLGVPRLKLRFVHKRFVVKFARGTGMLVLPLVVGAKQTLEELEGRIVVRDSDLDEFEHVVGVCGDLEGGKPEWWNTKRAGRWGARLTERTWMGLRDDVLERGIMEIRLGFVVAMVLRG